ncbi:MAG TPA: Glu-tRNA(Gln) amidotransferase subunit GatE [Candidatus Thermoplasmatota archaeon]|nr:Glu-tRNA(Gln) amidotransferase subunit GatE [Candidatus Thermoplasmatota archaeon]
MTSDLDVIGLVVGLEIHQQLDTAKLFCRCASQLDEATTETFVRRLKPTESELGEVDRAALEEARKNLVFQYVASRETSCLVELDEEPPHPMNPEALDVGLTIATLLGMTPLDEIHTMRKIVIDGSNTSGFQRTSLVAAGGAVETPHGRVGIQSLCLEEDSARKLDPADGLVRYRLDRLGIPLVEIATLPDIRTPEHARETAEALGMVLRATGRVKRGLGTIRQDLNVSIRGGARVEVKGVQDLRIIPVAIEYEARRQALLAGLPAKLRAAEARVADADVDVTPAFSSTSAKTVRRTIDAGGCVAARALYGFAGLLGRKDPAETTPKPRLGKELADYARARAGVKGLFHSDELPAYGVTQAEVDAVRAALALGPADAFVLVAERADVAARALEAAADRARLAFDGVPEETREVADDGSSRYLRPLPGGARMYPETDVPPQRVTSDKRARIGAALPELWPAKEKRFAKQYGLGAEEARALARGEDAPLFERLASTSGLPREAARVLLHTLPELEREGIPRDRIADATLEETFALLKEGAFAKEALAPVLMKAAKDGLPPRKAAESLGLGAADMGEVEAAVDALVAERAAFIRERGPGAASALMGPLMAKFRGRVPGETLSKLVAERVKRLLDG